MALLAVLAVTLIVAVTFANASMCLFSNCVDGEILDLGQCYDIFYRLASISSDHPAIAACTGSPCSGVQYLQHNVCQAATCNATAGYVLVSSGGFNYCQRLWG